MAGLYSPSRVVLGGPNTARWTVRGDQIQCTVWEDHNLGGNVDGVTGHTYYATCQKQTLVQSPHRLGPSAMHTSIHTQRPPPMHMSVLSHVYNKQGVLLTMRKYMYID
jgi:hypothetical protein